MDPEPPPVVVVHGIKDLSSTFVAPSKLSSTLHTADHKAVNAVDDAERSELCSSSSQTLGDTNELQVPSCDNRPAIKYRLRRYVVDLQKIRENGVEHVPVLSLPTVALPNSLQTTDAANYSMPGFSFSSRSFEENLHDLEAQFDDLSSKISGIRKGVETGDVNKPETQKEAKQKLTETKKREADLLLLEDYWNQVQRNPRNFDGWCSLLDHVETMGDVNLCRGAYNTFLPLYPYCYGYWQRYSKVEWKSSAEDKTRSFAVMERALEAMPLCADLWITLLQYYKRLYDREPNGEQIIREQYERAVNIMGLDFRSDSLWESYVEWETDRKQLWRVTVIFRKVCGIPTKLYNRHWDSLVAHIRDNPIDAVLTGDEYLELRRQSCVGLDTPFFEMGSQAVDPNMEDRVAKDMKERLMSQFISLHQQCKTEVDKRWDYEDHIRRPYFHVKPLTCQQLKNWTKYLDLEISEGNHWRILMLFERCLVTCALYENFWLRYANYMEKYSSHAAAKAGHPPTTDEEPVLQEEALDAETEQGSRRHIEGVTSSAPVVYHTAQHTLHALGQSGISNYAVPGVFQSGSDSFHHLRSIYQRACLVHCPDKPSIRLQWALFEEQQGNGQLARFLVEQVIHHYPSLLEPRFHYVNIERRAGNLDQVVALYEQLMDQSAAANLPLSQQSGIAMKYARFVFKVKDDPGKALIILRAALKKDRGNLSLYCFVLDLCYQRSPIDIRAVQATFDMALNSRELSTEEKLQLAQRKLVFAREICDIQTYRESLNFLTSLKEQVDRESMKVQPLSPVVAAAPVSRIPVPAPVAQPVIPVVPEGSAVHLHHQQQSWFQPEDVSQLITQVRNDREKNQPCYREVPPTDTINAEVPLSFRKDPEFQKWEAQRYEEYEKLEASRRESTRASEKRSGEAEVKVPNKKLKIGIPSPFKKAIASRISSNADGNSQPPVTPCPEVSFAVTSELPVVPLVGTSVKSSRKKGNARQVPPSSCPVKNVLDKLVTEGGKYNIGESTLKFSVSHRPNFLNDEENAFYFRSIRKNVKWLQCSMYEPRERKSRIQARLFAWLGPCRVTFNQAMFQSTAHSCTDVFNLMFRVTEESSLSLNACFLQLFRNGGDWQNWQLFGNDVFKEAPYVCVVVLGATRCIEFQPVKPPYKVHRMPLKRGSLYVFEGPFESDWYHGFPKDVLVTDEAIVLLFCFAKV